MNTSKRWLARILTVLTLISAVSSVAPSAQADTVYTYTGNPFNVLSGDATCPPICGISGYIVVASTIDFVDFRLEPVLTYSFTDGNTTLTPSNSNDFGVIGVSGDGLGNISQWVFGADGASVQLETIFKNNIPGCEAPCSSDSSGDRTGFSYVARKPGLWTTTAVATSEPPVLGLLFFGFIFAGVVLRKMRRVRGDYLGDQEWSPVGGRRASEANPC